MSELVEWENRSMWSKEKKGNSIPFWIVHARPVPLNKRIHRVEQKAALHRLPTKIATAS